MDEVIPLPMNHGWKKANDANGREGLVIDWITGPIAPDAVLSLLSCTCKRSCTLPDCVCLQHSMNCTEMCKLKSCSNQTQDEFETVLDASDASDDEA